MLKSFRSSDKKGKDGIEFGDEWFKRLMEKLKSASDVVCIFTERSLDALGFSTKPASPVGHCKPRCLGLLSVFH